MKGVIKTVRIADIELLLHWTFPAFLAFVALVQLLSGGPGEQIFVSALFILILFICIILHELGHAAAARYFGVETESIILLPVGGVATLERAPENPLQELIISVSGPLVNAVIAGFLAAILAATGIRTGIEDDFNLLGPATFLRNLMRVNLILAVFNLIPAFPMDGGRILRAILSKQFGRVRATRIAARIGQVVAVLFIFSGLFIDLFLALIGLFIIASAHTEVVTTERQLILRSIRVADVMMRDYASLNSSDTLKTAAASVLNGQVSRFLVMENEEVAGTLSTNDLIRGINEDGMDGLVGTYMNSKVEILRPDSPVEHLYEKMQAGGPEILPVFGQSGLVGAVDMENIQEYVMIRLAGLKRGQ